MTLPPKLKAKKVCELLGCCHATVHHLRKAGKLGKYYVRIGPKGGSSYMYNRDDVLAYERSTRRG